MGRFKLVCRSCQKTVTSGFHPVCECGGMMDPKYSLKNARIRDDAENPLLRFFDLLPVRRQSSLCWLGDGNTPTVHARELGKRFGVPKLYLKNETTNPTRTTKDRMASVVLSFFKEAGVSEFACSSTGNSSTSFARGVTKVPGFKLHVFVGRDFLHRMNFDSSAQIKVYWVKDATFAEAHECARAYAQRNAEITGERGFFNPGRREGLKLAFIEGVLDMPEAPHWYFQAASSGMGVYGAWRGAQQLYEMGRLRRLPRLACVQQETCAPMVSSWRAGSSVTRPQDIVAKPVGIAEAILRGNPSNTYPHLYNIVRESGGTFESVSDHEIREAQKMLVDTTGIDCCEAAATTLAAIRKMAAAHELRSDDVVFANITGAIRHETVTPREYVTLSKAELLPMAGRPASVAVATAIVRSRHTAM
jgi:threonine synthase